MIVYKKMGPENIERGYKPDQYDKLKFLIGLSAKGNPVYVLAMPKEDLSPGVLEKLEETSKIPLYVPLNGTIDFVVPGSEEEVKEVAKKIYEATGQNMGCVKYKGENMLEFYMILKDAIEIARAKGKPLHFYNPDEDSLQALIKKARSD